MKQIKLLSMHIQNFKGCKDRKIEFGDKTRIFGANATGKTTVFDAFTFLLFNRDSLGNTDFDVRPLDADGKMINSIEISVEAKISVDSDEYELKKVQKQKWVSCPIFVDNAESINDFNVPKMDAQMIHLTVTDDKELKVESEDK